MFSQPESEAEKALSKHSAVEPPAAKTESPAAECDK